MKTVDIGYVKVVATPLSAFGDHFVTDVSVTDISFLDRSKRDDLYMLNNERCYLVKKDELEAYVTRKEDLEKMNCTPIWDENKRLRDRIKQLEAENANLRDINKSLGELAAEVEELKERIDHLKIIQRLLAKENTSLLTENNKLRGTYNELNATVAKLRQELDKFHGEHTVEFLYEKHEVGKHIIGWTEVSGEEYELTFLTPERKIHE